MLTKIQITYDLADPAGILFFANTFKVAHSHIEHLAKNNWNLWSDWFNSETIGVPIRHAECNYLKPMFVGKEYQLKLSVKKIGDHSVNFIVDFLNSQGDVHAQVQSSHVFIDKKTKSKCKIPSKIRDLLESL